MCRKRLPMRALAPEVRSFFPLSKNHRFEGLLYPTRGRCLIKQKPSLGLRHRFGPTYAGAKVGHPSDPLRPCYGTHSHVLAVMDGRLDWRTLFQEINQPGAHMIDMVAHRRLGAFAVVCFKGFQDGQVGIGCA
jgi:hypothetical protein